MKTFCPYRICPLGAHIDHQYGVVSGTSVDIGITFEYEEINSSKIILSSLDYEGIYEFDIYFNNQRCMDWADYFRGVIEELKKKYKISKGLKGTFQGDLPSGGISSSSSSQIAFLLVICKINNIVLTKEEIIELVYQVEHEFMGLNVGILDPSCEVLGKKDSMLFLDTLTKYSFTIENKEFNKEYQFLILYSGIKRSLVGSKYNQRVEELKKCYNKLNIDNNSCGKLRDIPDYYYERYKDILNEVELKRSQHYFSEMERVRLGLQAWRKNDMIFFGKLMTESCLSSIYNYESGSKLLIDLFELTRSIDGVLGIRFLGAGFNGSSLALVEKNKADSIIKVIQDNYLKLYPELEKDFKIIPVELRDGVSL
ncbi:MAG: hypothetical protein K2P14_00615 [Anaeroplasmataceae bacterium]|nr:hypothetical protein [Anaeroplasmataceae bacterium]